MKRNEKGISDGLSVLVGLLAIVVAGLVIWGVSVALAPLFGAGNAYKTTESGNYRIANYEMFKDECNAVVAQEGRIKNLQSALRNDRASGADKDTLARDNTNVTAAQNVRVELIAQYNSDASKVQTKAKWRDANLPTYINPNDELGVVECP